MNSSRSRPLKLSISGLLRPAQDCHAGEHVCHGDRRSEPAALTRRPRGVSATNAMRSRVIPATASIRRHPLSVRVECLITLYLRVTVTRFWRTFRRRERPLTLCAWYRWGSSFDPAAERCGDHANPSSHKPHGTHQNLTWTSWFSTAAPVHSHAFIQDRCLDTNP